MSDAKLIKRRFKDSTQQRQNNMRGRNDAHEHAVDFKEP